MESILKLAIILVHFKKDNLKRILLNLKKQDRETFNLVLKNLEFATTLVNRARQLKQGNTLPSQVEHKLEKDAGIEFNYTEDTTYNELVDFAYSKDNKKSEVYFIPSGGD